MPVSSSAMQELKSRLSGELLTDNAMRTIYATDASEYQELPLAVTFPKSEDDVRELVLFAAKHGVGLIPRAAGTSLAGQVVGSGIVADIGRHMNAILEIDAESRRVRVQPGVVRNELNLALAEYSLFFAPETSTANRAMIAGMVGNNSCGANSIVYGATRDHVISARGFLADGSFASFGPLSAEEFAAKCEGPDSLETRIYCFVRDLLSDATNRQLIRDHFPKATVTRRNTGYALDLLMDAQVFDPGSDRPFNLCRLICGSEGTLFIGTEFELNCEPLPPAGGLLCAHFETVQDALKATLIAMAHRPFGCELMDHHVLDGTKSNLEQSKNRFFINGDPAAVLVIEVRNEDHEFIESEFSAMESECRAADLGYAFPRVWGSDMDRVWELRRAGQGLMNNNIKGSAKPREVVEDTAVAVEDLPAYIAEFDELLHSKYGISTVYYAHAGAGELHTRPLFDLKTEEGLRMFRGIATDIAHLVKKYRGSLSGEHGDGRLRGEFIPLMVGAECYAMMRQVKQTFDPKGILNPGKIIDTPPMDTSLRHAPGNPTPKYETVFDFSESGGFVGATEKCIGVGLCRKTALMGGTMCPSYMATRNEKDSTRARANMLRNVMTNPKGAENPWDSEEVRQSLDLCISCKGCKAECPTNVDMTRMKAEWQQHYYDVHGVPFRSRLIANFSKAMKLASLAPWLSNWFMTNPVTSRAFKKMVGFAVDRSLPPLHSTTLAAWYSRHGNTDGPFPNGRVYLFCDEFTNYNDTTIGIQAIQLLNRLGYEVIIPEHVDSGRAHLSKGLIREAQKLAIRNVELLCDVITSETPLIGIEPSAILSFRDEYPDLVSAELKDEAKALAENALLIDEFFGREIDQGRMKSSSFHTVEHAIKLQGHCHQKALSSLVPTVKMLELPKNYKVSLIPSGCCGMAGSFGYEAEHYELSQQIGELILYPTLRKTPETTLIAAPGTSCRHQIKDGVHRIAKHPVEILYEALV